MCLVRCNITIFGGQVTPNPKGTTVHGIGVGNTCAEAEKNGELQAKANLANWGGGRKLDIRTQHCHAVQCVE